MSTSLARRLIFSFVPAVVIFSLVEVWASYQLDGALLERAGPLGWTALPNLDQHVVRPGEQASFVVSTNADGLRTPHGRERTAPGKRVVIFGESTIFGWGDGDYGHIAPLVERIVGERAHVVNAGQPGYSSEMVRGLAEVVLPAYKPDIVVHFQPWNDLKPWSQTDRDSIPTHPATLAQRGLFSSLSIVRYLRDRRLRSPPKAPHELPEIFAMDRPKEDADGSVIRVPEAYRTENILAIRELCESNDAIFVTSQLSMNNSQPAGVGPSADLTRQLHDLAAQEGYLHIDLTQTLIGTNRADVMQATSKFHFTPFANQMFAREIAEGLQPFLDPPQ